MFYFLGFLRRTALFALVSLPVSLFTFGGNLKKIFVAAMEPDSLIEYFCAFMFWSIIAYPVIATIHVIMCKISDRDGSAIESYFCALGSDIVSPVRYIGIFLLVMTKKHIIKDDSAWHNFEDLLQVIWGFVWTILMTAFIAYGFLNIGKL